MTTEKSNFDEPPEYRSINEFVLVGEFGFHRVEGPFHVDKDGTEWHIEADTDERIEFHEPGVGAVLIADGQAVGGGVLKSIDRVEGDLLVAIDQYAQEDV